MDEPYEVALSFAGEDRGFVQEVAVGLRSRGVRVFYDTFEQAALWGRDLGEVLSNVYANANYTVMFVSEAYVRKEWTRFERRSALERAITQRVDSVLPARFDDVEVPGLPRTVGYIDLRHTAPSQVIELLLRKLGNFVDEIAVSGQNRPETARTALSTRLIAIDEVNRTQLSRDRYDHIAYTADGRHLLVCRDRAIDVTDAVTLDILSTIQTAEPVVAMVQLPDEAHLIVVTRKELHLFDRHSRERVAKLEGLKESAITAAFLRDAVAIAIVWQTWKDGNPLVATPLEWGITVVHLDDGHREEVLRRPGVPHCIRFTPDGERFVIATERWGKRGIGSLSDFRVRYALEVIQARDGQLVVRLEGSQTQPSATAISGTGARVAAQYRGARADIWDTSSGIIEKEFLASKGRSGPISITSFEAKNFIEFSYDSRFLAAADDGPLLLLDSFDGRRIEIDAGGFPQCVSFSPTGRFLAVVASSWEGDSVLSIRRLSVA